MRITVIGTGTWGTTLAVMSARGGHDTTLWGRVEFGADELIRERENRAFLPGIPFPKEMGVTIDPRAALRGCEVVLFVVPAQTMRENILMLREYIPKNAAIVSAAKGLEMKTLLRMSQVLKQELPPEQHDRIAAISGPNLAREISRGLPAGSVVASENDDVACLVQRALMTPLFRIYTTTDIIGVELAGALKNIIAIGAGIADGLMFGDNAKAGFLTRGIAEIARLGVAMGANPLTFSGMAGIGDLICTCASSASRNHYVGEHIARGFTLEQIQSTMLQVAEGVPTTVAARTLAQKMGVEMPIAEQVYRVLFEGKNPREAVYDLMTRSAKPELG